MRIGEVTVIGPPGETKEIFIRSVCQKLEKVNDNICFGRLDINNQLALHIYGISVEKDEISISWDLLSPKMLGYIFIFNWDEQHSLEKIKTVLDTFSNNFSAPIIVIANVDDESNIPLPEKYNEPGGISIDRNIKFIFCPITNSAYSRNAVATIIDILLENLP